MALSAARKERATVGVAMGSSYIKVVAVMKANLDGFVKDLKDDELNALKAYMLSVN